MKRGEMLFQSLCIECHGGADGRATGKHGHPLRKARPDDTPEQLFVNVGCAACHGEGAPFRDRLLGAVNKPDADVAAWILDPQASKPGSPMPSFQNALDPAQAERLAKYVKTLARARWLCG